MSDITSQQLVVFSLGSEEYALPIGAVHEIISALGQESKVLEWIKLGAKDFVVKPFQADRVLDAVGKALA